MTASQAKMAAEIQTERATGTAQVGGVRKPQLLNKLEGCSDTVNMAVIIAGEDGVISVSDDRYEQRHCHSVSEPGQRHSPWRES